MQHRFYISNTPCHTRPLGLQCEVWNAQEIQLYLEECGQQGESIKPCQEPTLPKLKALVLSWRLMDDFISLTKCTYMLTDKYPKCQISKYPRISVMKVTKR